MFGLAMFASVPPALAQQCIEIRCSTNLVVECSDPGGTRVKYTVLATNHCWTNVTLTCTPPPGSLFAPGVTTVLCSGTDFAGNSNGCIFTVTVRDTTPPEILCPRMLRMPCESPGGATVRFSVVAADNCDSNVTVVCDPPSGTLFPIGTNTVVCTGTDKAGNVGRCTFPVIVTGDCKPDPCVSIVCPRDIRRECNTPGGAVVTFAVQATNTCDTNLVVTCDPPSGSIFPVGLTTVLCVAQAGRANIARCSFLVEITDTNPPAINCPSNIVAAAEGVDGAVVRWNATATDDCDTNVVVRCHPVSGSFFPLGRTLVRCIATDHSGNQSSCGFVVTVRGERPLEITHEPPASVRLRWEVGGGVEVATNLDPGDWRPLTGPVMTNGDERTLIHPLSGIQFFRLAAPPLVPPSDQDKDGVPDLLDRCPGTLAGLAVDKQGCSLIKLATRPESIAGEPMRNLAGLLDHLREFRSLAAIALQIEDGLLDMEMALGRIRAGEITGREFGVEQFSAAAARLRMAHSNFLALITRHEQDLLANPPSMQGYADMRPEDTEIAVLRDLANRLIQYLEEIAQAEDSLMGVARSITGLKTLRAEIAEVNDAERWIKLNDGRILALPDKEIPGRLAPGRVVDIDVQEFDDGTGVANAVKPVNVNVPFPADLPPVECLYLRVLPVQEFPPISDGPFVKHQLSAYQHDDLLYLEAGMRFAVESGNCPLSIRVQDGTIIRYRMKLDLYYKPLNGSWQTVTLASSLGPASTPVAVPEDASAQYTYTLTATVFRQECPLFGLPVLCSEPEDLSVTVYNVRIYPRYTYGTATYEDTVFDLEDSPEETSFRTTRVNGVSASGALSSLSQVHFLGLAFTVFGPQSSYPNFGFVFENHLPFAVYESDIVDNTFFKELTLGTTNRAAMYWPRMVGYHNGYPFWYTCELPVITRDAVSICPSQPHAFYRLPFKGGWPTWTISQGNLSSISHTGTAAYAYDFAAPENTKIRATRGGIVESLSENLSANTYDPDLGVCTSLAANFVAVRHQDGTIGRYGHMPQNGVLVSVGQKVRRGDLIALVGETGCASGPHLHFEVRNASGSTSIASRFEAWGVCSPELGVVLPCLPLRECYVPDTGQGLMSILFSNNKPWWE